jgi:arylsulfatase A-like enzyme
VPASVEGVSFAPILRDPSRTSRRKLLLENFTRTQVEGRAPSYCGVRTRDYLYVHYATGAVELYNERRDPYELHNAAGDPALAAVQRRLLATTKRLCTPRPPGLTF